MRFVPTARHPCHNGIGHAAAEGADCRDPRPRRDPEVHRGQTPLGTLSLARESSLASRRAKDDGLRRLLLGRYPVPLSVPDPQRTSSFGRLGRPGRSRRPPPRDEVRAAPDPLVDRRAGDPAGSILGPTRHHAASGAVAAGASRSRIPARTRGALALGANARCGAGRPRACLELVRRRAFAWWAGSGRSAGETSPDKVVRCRSPGRGRARWAVGLQRLTSARCVAGSPGLDFQFSKILNYIRVRRWNAPRARDPPRREILRLVLDNRASAGRDHGALPERQFAPSRSTSGCCGRPGSSLPRRGGASASTAPRGARSDPCAARWRPMATRSTA